MKQKRKKILIMRTDRLGDVILSTPAITNLRKFYPDSYIAFLCRPYTKDIVDGNPYLDEIIIYDKNEKHKSIFSSIKFCLSLRKKNFDTVFILNPNNRSNLSAVSLSQTDCRSKDKNYLQRLAGPVLASAAVVLPAS